MDDVRTLSARRKRVRWLALALLAITALGLFAWWPHRTEVEVFKQPADIAYADGSQHTVVLKHVRAPIATVLIAPVDSSAVDYHEFVIGRDPGGEYGHRVRFESTSVAPENVKVRWTAEGVFLEFASGHQAFVPADAFIGGR